MKTPEPGEVCRCSNSKSRPSILVVSITAVLITVIIVTGFVVTSFMYKQPCACVAKHTEGFKGPDGEMYTEDIEEDINAHITTIQVHGPDGKQFTYIKDNPNSMDVAIPDMQNERICLILLQQDHSADKCNEVIWPTGDPIEDTSFLDSRIQQKCYGHKVYWTDRQCDNEYAVQRQKRQIWDDFYNWCQWFDNQCICVCFYKEDGVWHSCKYKRGC